MTGERFLSRPQYLSLKAASRHLVGANGTQEQASAVTRLDQSELSRAGSNTVLDRFLPLDVVADLEAASGEPVVTRELARLADCVLIEPPKLAPGDELARQVGQSAQRFGELMTHYGAATADTVIDAGEARQIVSDAHAMIQALWHVMETAKARAEASNG